MDPSGRKDLDILFIPFGMLIGMGIGGLLGNTAAGMSIGVFAGLIVGLMKHFWRQRKLRKKLGDRDE